MPKRVHPSMALVRELRAEGFELVVGIDEVGRGCLAGPVVAAAVLLADEIKLPGVRDSKLLPPANRERLARRVKQAALAVGLGWVRHSEIDEHGLTWAVRQSGLRALGDLQSQADFVILDGNHNYLAETHRSRAYIKADMTCLPVAAASIIAKVARDQYMHRVAALYPGFGFETNVGYATPLHLRALRLNVSPIHRRSFRPLAHGYVH